MAINPGSGGPLLNIRGEVIGVNTMIATQSGGYQGIGFALPVNMAVKVYNQLTRTGRVAGPSVSPGRRAKEKPEVLKALGTTHGVIVDQVTPGGGRESRAQAGRHHFSFCERQAREGWRRPIARVADTPVGAASSASMSTAAVRRWTSTSLFAIVPRYLRTIRGSRVRSTETPEKEEGSEVKFGMTSEPAILRTRRGQNQEQRGVVVTRVQESSFAEEIGLREKDIIVG